MALYLYIPAYRQLVGGGRAWALAYHLSLVVASITLLDSLIVFPKIWEIILEYLEL